jgi:hypothetical protein
VFGLAKPFQPSVMFVGKATTFQVLHFRIKKLPNISKSTSKVSKAKKAKISTTKLNLKAQNIYIKQLL